MSHMDILRNLRCKISTPVTSCSPEFDLNKSYGSHFNLYSESQSTRSTVKSWHRGNLGEIRSYWNGLLYQSIQILLNLTQVSLKLMSLQSKIFQPVEWVL